MAQIGDRSVEDEDIDTALNLAQVDIYERRLREQVRRKRVARDYQVELPITAQILPDLVENLLNLVNLMHKFYQNLAKSGHSFPAGGQVLQRESHRPDRRR